MTPIPSSYPMRNIIIGLILQGKKYGYELYKEVSDPVGLGAIWNLRQSQLYLIINKMCTEGLIRQTISERVQGRIKRCYEVTQSGSKNYRDWLKTPVIYPRNFMQEFFPKFYLSRKYGIDDCGDIVDIQLKKVNGWIHENQQQILNCGNEFQKKIYLYKKEKIFGIRDWLEKERK